MMRHQLDFHYQSMSVCSIPPVSTDYFSSEFNAMEVQSAGPDTEINIDN